MYSHTSVHHGIEFDTGISSRLCPVCAFSVCFSHELSSTITKTELTEGVGYLTHKQKV